MFCNTISKCKATENDGPHMYVRAKINQKQILTGTGGGSKKHGNPIMKHTKNIALWVEQLDWEEGHRLFSRAMTIGIGHKLQRFQRIEQITISITH